MANLERTETETLHQKGAKLPPQATGGNALNDLTGTDTKLFKLCQEIVRYFSKTADCKDEDIQAVLVLRRARGKPEKAAVDVHYVVTHGDRPLRVQGMECVKKRSVFAKLRDVEVECEEVEPSSEIADAYPPQNVLGTDSIEMVYKLTGSGCANVRGISICWP